MPSLRLFIAVETPPDIKPQIAAIGDRLRTCGADVKWEPDEKLHATIKFLGSADEGLLPEIVSLSKGVCSAFPSLSLKYSGVGCFPNLRAPRVVWIGMKEPEGTLESLQHKLEAAVEPLGFKREDRDFHPHVTLGRVKSQKRIGSLLRMMESITFESQPVIINEIVLIKSELKSSGSVYTTLHAFPLTA